MCVLEQHRFISYHSPHPSTPSSQKGIGNLLSPHTPPPCWFQTPYTHPGTYIYCYRKSLRTAEGQKLRGAHTWVRQVLIKCAVHFTEFSGLIYFNVLARSINKLTNWNLYCLALRKLLYVSYFCTFYSIYWFTWWDSEDRNVLIQSEKEAQSGKKTDKMLNIM